MAVEVTYHGKSRPRDGEGAFLDCLPAQVGAMFPVTAGVSGALTEGMYEITATSDGLVRWGDGSLVNATGGKTWKSGTEKIVWVAEGGKIAASAAILPPAIAAPMLSNLSSGWTTGDNPPKWEASFSNPIDYDQSDGTGDKARARYNLNGGAWVVSEWLPFDEIAYAEGFKYAFLSDGTLSGGGSFEVQEMHGRDVGLGTELLSPWSNSWTDALSAPRTFTGFAALPTQTTVNSTTETFPLAMPSAGRPVFGFFMDATASPVFTVRRTSDNVLVATASSVAGGGLERVSGSGRRGLFQADAVIPAGNYTVTLTSANINFASAQVGFLSNASGAITGTAYYDLANTSGILAANQDIAVTAGGIMVILALADNGTNLTGAGAETLVSNYADSRFWITATTTLTPKINSFGGNSAIYAVGFN